MKFKACVTAISFAIVLLGCTARTGGSGLQPRPHRLIDNLFIENPGGEVSLANLAGGSFSLKSRCLILVIGDGPRTPIFEALPNEIDVRPDGMTVRGMAIAYGQPYVFPGLAPGSDLRIGNANCPAKSVVISSIDHREKYSPRR